MLPDQRLHPAGQRALPVTAVTVAGEVLEVVELEAVVVLSDEAAPGFLDEPSFLAGADGIESITLDGSASTPGAGLSITNYVWKRGSQQIATGVMNAGEPIGKKRFLRGFKGSQCLLFCKRRDLFKHQ